MLLYFLKTTSKRMRNQAYTINLVRHELLSLLTVIVVKLAASCDL